MHSLMNRKALVACVMLWVCAGACNAFAQSAAGPERVTSAEREASRAASGGSDAPVARHDDVKFVGPAESASSNLLVNTPVSPPLDVDIEPHALRSVSMFAVLPPQPRKFREHDLVQIVVRESSRTERTQELDTKKSDQITAQVNAWPRFRLEDMLELMLYAGRTDQLPALDIESGKQFKGEGEYTREDDMTDRITAEVIEILPNGNLVLEARTFIKTDDEESTLKLTGVCRPDDVTDLNTVMSNQIHDLNIVKTHSGELRDANKRGVIAEVFDTIFAW